MFHKLVNFLLFGIVILSSCNKDDASGNKAPSCNITSPNNGEEIIKGSIHSVMVEADDSDGSITMVRIYIDDVIIGSSNSIPYNFKWNTSEQSIGDYLLKATAEDNESGSSIDEISISIVENIGNGEPCPDMPSVTDIDGNVYNTVLIGDQCWMKENLKTTTYNNDTPIPNVTDNDEWQNLINGAYAWYNNSSYDKDKYGALYNWYAIKDSNGLCPSGWHVPSNNEWMSLINHIGGTDYPNGNKLKSCRQINSPFIGGCNTTEPPRWYESSHYGTNEYGFSGLPGGGRYDVFGNFINVGHIGFWWSSSEHSSAKASYSMLQNNTGNVIIDHYSKHFGFSVRCLKD